MTLRNAAISTVFALALGTSTACAGGNYVAVRYAPPPPRYGVMGYSPGPGYVWCDGYWDWRGNNWIWIQGAWRRPPRARAAWVPGYWRPQGRGHVFIRGYWR